MYNLNDTSITNHYSTRQPAKKQGKYFLLALHNAIRNKEFNLEYQPRYDTATGYTTIFVALVRWHSKDVGTIYPNEFIDVAIKHDLIFSLNLLVFKKCCVDLIWMRKNLDKNIKISVRISQLECESLHHTQKILYICKLYGLKLSDFEFEITKRTHVHTLTKVKTFCNTVIEHGASISLDDFDAYFSQLNNLSELPISHIKIKKYCIHKIGDNAYMNTVISHLIKLAHKMNIKVIAEGIEHAYQRDQLIKSGCDQLQGFFMCKPLSPEKITIDHIHMRLA